MERPLRLVLVLLAGLVAVVTLGVGIVTRSTQPSPQAVRSGCLACHTADALLDPVHAPLAIDCATCHLGDRTATDKDRAHAGMTGFPGNLDVVDRTCGTCHAASVTHLRASLMNTGRGMVSVNRFAFEEIASPDADASLATMGTSPAESHVRQLCIECHVGFPRTNHAPLGPGVRGGGCSACHLQEEGVGKHPSMTARIPDSACFSCHSGSGRIALSFAGWHETERTPEERRTGDEVIAEGRVLEKHEADVHHERGLGCIDCHTLRDVMGDGVNHAHEEQAVEVRCDDCHRTTKPPTATGSALDDATTGLLRRNPNLPRADSQFVLTSRGRPYTNVTWEGERVVVTSKATGRRFEPKSPDSRCAGTEHQRLECRACHTAWAPSCLGCHTARMEGEPWRESAGTFLADAPALGVQEDRIVPVAPGMVMTIEDAGKVHEVRLFAPIAPHTTGVRARSCESCHRDPAALGLGRRTLKGEPAYQLLDDGLPADAWVGDSVTRGSTRTDLRPFNADERKRILDVTIDTPTPNDR